MIVWAPSTCKTVGAVEGCGGYGGETTAVELSGRTPFALCRSKWPAMYWPFSMRPREYTNPEAACGGFFSAMITDFHLWAGRGEDVYV